MSNWTKIKVTCPQCNIEFTKTVPPSLPPELGKVIVHLSCLSKFIWWNNKLFSIKEEIPHVRE